MIGTKSTHDNTINRKPISFSLSLIVIELDCSFYAHQRRMILFKIINQLQLYSWVGRAKDKVNTASVEKTLGHTLRDNHKIN